MSGRLNSDPPAPELTAAHLSNLERLNSRGFAIVAFPLYASAVGLRRGAFAALLAPLEGGGFRLLGEPYYLIEGNLSVRVIRNGRPTFVWKKREVQATPELLAELASFSKDVSELLLPML